MNIISIDGNILSSTAISSLRVKLDEEFEQLKDTGIIIVNNRPVYDSRLVNNSIKRVMLAAIEGFTDGFDRPKVWYQVMLLRENLRHDDVNQKYINILGNFADEIDRKLTEIESKCYVEESVGLEVMDQDLFDVIWDMTKGQLLTQCEAIFVCYEMEYNGENPPLESQKYLTIFQASINKLASS